MIRRFFPLLLLAGLLPLSGQVLGLECSPYLGRAVLNEFEQHNQSCSSDLQTFVEAKMLDQALISNDTYKDWTLTLCAKAPTLATPTPRSECISGNLEWANDHAGIATYEPNMNYGSAWVVDDAPDNPWIPLHYVPSCYVDLNNGNKHGMEALLLDGEGKVVDYLSVDGYSTIGDPGCSFWYDTDYAGGNNFNIQRIPDGTGGWDDTGSGASGDDTQDSTNDPVPEDPADLITVTVDDTSTVRGSDMVFTIHFSPALSSAVTIAYRTIDDTATSPDDFAAVADWTQLTVSSGGSVTVSVPTTETATENAYFHLVIQRVSGDIQITDQTAMGTILAGPDLASLAIVPNSGSASTCSPQTIQVQALDTNGDLLADYTGTISLNTSSGHGDWSFNTTQNAATGSFTAIGADQGSASYTFVEGNGGAAYFDLRNLHAEDLTITATDSDAGITVTSGTFQFRDNMFVINEDPTQVAGKPMSFSVEFWTMQRDADGNPILDADGKPSGCQLVSDYNNPNQPIAFSLVRDTDDPGGDAPTIGGTAIPDAVASSTINLDFSAGGNATFTLDSTDVGKYSLRLTDSSGAYSGQAITTDSDVLTVRPFTLGLNIYETDDPANTNPGGTTTGPDTTAFIPAATPFSADITGLLWQAADDANNDGIPDAGADLSDNGTAVSFAWDTSLTESAPYTPDTPAGNELSGTLNIPSGSYSNGAATVDDLKYGEVGSFTLTADVSGYLNSPGVDLSASSVVGRFTAAYYTIDSASITPANGAFTYLSQPMTLDMTVSARNADGELLQLYDEHLSNPYPFTAGLNLFAEDSDDGSDLSARAASTASFDWQGGQAAVVSAQLTLSRDPATHAERFGALQFGATLIDSDGIGPRNSDLDMNPGTSGDCSLSGNCTAQAVAGTQDLRFGRMILEDICGPETQALTIPLQAQYYDVAGAGFRSNVDDSASTYNSTDASLDPTSYTGELADGETAITDTSGDIPLSSGSYDPATPLSLTAPGVGNTGSVDVSLTVPGWLEFDWDSDGSYSDDPSATASFGCYRGNDRIIYWQEIFN